MSLRLVIADDDVALRVLLRQLVDRDGRLEVVSEAGDGREAIARVEEHDPDVLLLDLGMPVLDGLQVLEALQGRPRPRIVVLSGFADPDIEQQATGLGAAAYLIKGSGFASFLDVLAGDAPADPAGHR